MRTDVELAGKNTTLILVNILVILVDNTFHCPSKGEQNALYVVHM